MKPRTLRLRIFAGPNGSGKSTMFERVRSTRINDQPIDIGHYFNADTIAAILKSQGRLDLAGTFGFNIGRASLISFARKSGLVREKFNELTIRNGHRFDGSTFILIDHSHAEAFAQLLTAWFCDLMIQQKLKFSFETVFSHPSKLDLMRKAKAKGYKVYLYFIATNDVEINKDRIRTRVLQKGHDVPNDRVEKRYELSLGQLMPALDLCYHAFLFDNSGEESDNSGERAVMFAEMKQLEHGRAWYWTLSAIPDWFIKHYLLPKNEPQFLDVARQAIDARLRQ